MAEAKEALAEAEAEKEDGSGLGDGHVLVSALLDPSDACTQNVVLYVETLVP